MYIHIRFKSCKSWLIRAVCASFSSPVAINNKGNIDNQKTAKLLGSKNVNELIHSGSFVKFRVFQGGFLRNY